VNGAQEVFELHGVVLNYNLSTEEAVFDSSPTGNRPATP
jgi:hypothetical protein